MYSSESLLCICGQKMLRPFKNLYGYVKPDAIVGQIIVLCIN